MTYSGNHEHDRRMAEAERLNDAPADYADAEVTSGEAFFADRHDAEAFVEWLRTRYEVRYGDGNIVHCAPLAIRHGYEVQWSITRRTP